MELDSVGHLYAKRNIYLIVIVIEFDTLEIDYPSSLANLLPNHNINIHRR